MASASVRIPFFALGLALALPAAALASAGPRELPAHEVADPDAPAVTAANLLDSERFWPYQVALVRPWGPGGSGATLPTEFPGVLVRVESPTLARIDFGRDGVHEVPIDATDLVARAERVRRGELEKTAPNFVWAIGARLLDSSAPALATLSLPRIAANREFLCVFADPRAEDFPELARALAPLRGRDGVETILFPQGQRPDVEVYARLRSLGWTVPFVHDHLSEAYTRSLVAEGTPTPSVLLVTDEGRVLLQRRTGAGLVAALDGEIAPH